MGLPRSTRPGILCPPDELLRKHHEGRRLHRQDNVLTPAQKQAVLKFTRNLKGRSFTFRDVVRHLNLDSDDRRSLQHYLDELDSEEIIHRVKRGQYALPARESIASGILTCHRDGYGFLTPDETSLFGQDIFIPPHRLEGALHGDRILVRVSRKKRPSRSDSHRRPSERNGEERLEGEVLRVIERKSLSIVGKYYEHPRYPYVVPLDARLLHDIRVPFHDSGGARNGQIVVIGLTVPPGRNQEPLGKVIEVLGHAGDPGIEYRIVQHRYGLPVKFSREAENEAARIPDHVLDSELRGREDFRAELAVTIDGEDARDFDDAITLKRLPGGPCLLGVHIADVSRYVREGSAIDGEAWTRGTSVYFPDRAIPMLPSRLSSGICSLNPDVDRLVFSVLMEVDGQGRVVSHRFVEGILRSRARMTYTSVAKILEQRDPAEREKHRAFLEFFETMEQLCHVLSAKRYRRGAVDFDLPEAEIEFDDKGRVLAVVPAERNIAHRIIEEFMLLANETVAEALAASGVPALYRIHEKPDTKKVDDFAEFALALGYSLRRDGAAYRPADFQKFVRQLQGKPEGRFLSYLMLRSFMQARYSEENVGHFGLAAESYTHFTSPIRRYPDLVVHRLLKEALWPRPSTEWREQMAAKMAEIALHTSARERIADEAEREIEKIKKVEFMADKVGDEFEAVVFSVIRQGCFVELLEHYVEGFVPVGTLIDDFYEYKEKTHSFVGERHRRRIQLGTRMIVRLDHADPENYRLTFSPAE
jgi:ribonuclease R